MTRRLLALSTALALVAGAATIQTATAQTTSTTGTQGASNQVTGTVREVDRKNRTITLQDGTRYVYSADGAPLESIRPGAQVRIQFREGGDGGQRTALGIEPASQSGSGGTGSPLGTGSGSGSPPTR